MKKIILTVILIFSVLLSQFSVCAEDSQMYIFVDGKIAESGDGSVDAPFKTIEEARDMIREMKKRGEYPQKGVTIYIRGGEYSRSETFYLGTEDSGYENAPVTYMAYPTEEVTFIGGTRLNLSQFKIADSGNFDSSLKGKIYSYNLMANGIEPYDRIYVIGHGASAFFSELAMKYNQWLPEEELKQLSPPEIFFDNESMTLAQYPNAGEPYLKIDQVIRGGDSIGFIGEDWAADKENYVLPETIANPLTPKFIINDPKVKNWGNAKYAWMNGWWQQEWSSQTLEVLSIEPESGTIESKTPTCYSAINGAPFYIFNLIEELDIPGEWYYDRDSGELYIYPPKNDPSSEIMIAFSSESVITVDKAEYINFKNINVKASRTNGFEIFGSNNINIEYCEISNFSGRGIYVLNDADGGWSKDMVFRGNYIHDIGNIGIAVEKAGDYETLEPSNILLENNWIHTTGRLQKTYSPCINANGVGITVRHNLLYDTPHACLQYGGNDNIVEYNEIHTACQEASDMGAVYTGRSYTRRGNILRYNYIHDIDSIFSASHRVGIYWDDAYCGQTAYGNVIANAESGIFLNCGRDNNIFNNVFVNLDYGILSGSNQTRYATNNYVENLLKDAPYQSEPYKKYPNLYNVMEDEPGKTKHNSVKDNVAFNIAKSFYYLVAWDGSDINELYKINELEDGYVPEDGSEFVDLDNNNFTLKSDSTVFENIEGFENLDTVEKAGLITSKTREIVSDGAVCLVIGKPQSMVNWERKLIDENNLNVAPFIENDRTYVPVRFLASMLGSQVSWEDGKAVIVYDEKTMVLENGAKEIVIDGTSVAIDSEIMIKNDRTFVPLRAASELFGKNVFWDESGVIIVSDENIEDILTENIIFDIGNRL